MKNLPTYEDFINESIFLNEIGDMKPLDWDDIKVNGKTTTYEFYLGPEFYEVEIVRVNNTKISVSFKADGSDNSVTNSGKPLLVFSTVVSFMKDYIEKNPGIKFLGFVPEKTDSDDSRRLKIYMHYIKSSFDVADIDYTNLSRGYVSIEVELK